MATIGTDTKNIRELRKSLREHEHINAQDWQIIHADAKQVFGLCPNVGSTGTLAKGLIYGYVQSGKTAVILATMALAADNGYKRFIVLTSNLNDLYDQTLGRVERSLPRFEVVGKPGLARYQPSGNIVAPIAIVATKHAGVLGKVSRIIQANGWADESVIVIDDEADQAGLDTNINKQRPPSPVNQAILNIRNALPTQTYLQTTATPAALLLQDNAAAFKPDFVVVTRPGTDYTGGDVFFHGNPANSHYLRLVSTLDVQNLRTDQELPETVKRSLLTFFMGAATLRIHHRRKNYAYLLHTSFKKDDHRFAFELVEAYFNQISREMAIFGRVGQVNVDKEMLRDMRAVHRDLGSTVPNMPTLAAILNEMADNITSTQVVEINSRTGAGVNPDPNRLHVVYIGGTKIGRGVTIKNLLVTYYGRDAKTPQMDTVLQHARMYGYRQSELHVTRVFLPPHLATRFATINQVDNDMRGLVGTTNQAIQLIPFTGGRIKPTRSAVLRSQNVDLNTYLAGSKYFPALPISDPNVLGSQTEAIDAILSSTAFPNLQSAYPISIDDLIALLGFKFGTVNIGTWNDALIRNAIGVLKTRNKLTNGADLVIVNRRSRLSLNRAVPGGATLGAVLPGNNPDAPYGVRRNVPALYMTRLVGATDLQWHGAPFWVPVLRFPDGNYAFAANYS
jgi:hypothetical protein